MAFVVRTVRRCSSSWPDDRPVARELALRIQASWTSLWGRASSSPMDVFFSWRPKARAQRKWLISALGYPLGTQAFPVHTLAATGGSPRISATYRNGVGNRGSIWWWKSWFQVSSCRAGCCG